MLWFHDYFANNLVMTVPIAVPTTENDKIPDRMNKSAFVIINEHGRNKKYCCYKRIEIFDLVS